ncbi:hypothetical protein JB92DRAFT_2890218, partial [Gautieria morchelliformis]
MWQLCLTLRESVSLLVALVYRSFKPQVRCGPHCAIATVLVLMNSKLLTSSNCHSPSRCVSYLWHKQ